MICNNIQCEKVYERSGNFDWSIKNLGKLLSNLKIKRFSWDWLMHLSVFSTKEDTLGIRQPNQTLPPGIW